MSATYSGNPSSSDQDQVRFLLGDTNMSEAKFTDEEVDFLLSTWIDPILAAAEGAQVLSSSATHWISYTADGNSLSLDQMQAKYSLLADQLRAMYRRANRAAPWNAQANRGEFEAYAADESVVRATFGKGMHDDRRNEGVYFGAASPEDLRGDFPADQP